MFYGETAVSAISLLIGRILSAGTLAGCCIIGTAAEEELPEGVEKK